ncbi:MAG TPA: SDR family oxidoreductase [Tepidisphaeraceae bacterium]|jgi:short-subunit dehydrogenase|nr:SDR family oxidoreductase [Tepidisphaeraceae bacterium]
MRRHHNASSSSFLRSAVITLGAAAIAAEGAKLLARRGRRLDLDGKVVLITGGSRGLGLVMARQLAERGAKLAICARDADELSRAEAELSAVAPAVLAVPCDVAVPEQLANLVDRVRNELGSIDVLINNASQLIVAPAAHQQEADYRTMLDTTFWAAYRLTELVLPDMRANGGGRIVNISSIGGLIPAPHMASYVAGKHALTGYSRAMRNELARENILVTTVHPGLVRTGSPRNVTVRGNAPAEYAWFKISDSLPFTSMSAERAASNIIDALVHGDADLTLTLSAKLGATVQQLFPNFAAFAGDLMNRALPDPIDATGDRPVKGRDAETPLSRSVLGRLTDQAAVRNNERA